MFKFYVIRIPPPLSGAASVVATHEHPDRDTAEQRALSHAKRLARLDAGLTVRPTYAVGGEGTRCLHPES